jgi:hypothetical protein
MIRDAPTTTPDGFVFEEPAGVVHYHLINTTGHPGKGQVLRAKVGRRGEAVKLLVRRLQAEVEALTD